MAERVENIVKNIAEALPGMTNQLGQVLVRASEAVSNANVALVQLQPSLTNMQALTQRLTTEDGVIGRMVLTTNLQTQVSSTLASMDSTLTNTTALIRTSEVQLQDLTRRIALTLDNVAMVTSNLSAQVNANSLMLGEVSSLVVNADDMVQGLKRHWLLRSAFGPMSNAPIDSMVIPSLDLSPRTKRKPLGQRRKPGPGPLPCSCWRWVGGTWSVAPPSRFRLRRPGLGKKPGVCPGRRRCFSPMATGTEP
jgi:hypothetical protein